MFVLRVLGFLIVLAASVVQASDAVYIVAHEGLELSENEVMDVYTGDKQFAGSLKLTPVDNSAAQAFFLQNVMRINLMRYTSQWTKKSFREGVSPPKVFMGDAAVIAFVKGTPGALGYVRQPDSSVKVLFKY